MAKKDTLKALINRGVSEEVASLVLTKYTSLTSISEAGADALVELGIAQEEAEAIIVKIGKRPSSSKVKKEVCLLYTSPSPRD